MKNQFAHLRTVVALVLVLGSLLPACKKYEEGPVISFTPREERVTNAWQAQVISRNDIDETVDYEYMYLNFQSNGSVEWLYKRTDDPTEVKFEGNPTWELATLDAQIKVTYTEDGTFLTRLLYFDILRLKEDELWLNYTFDGDNHSLRLIPR